MLDGNTPDSPILATYCGYTIPNPVRTTSNQLRVVFTTDYSVSGRGFLLSWQAVREGDPAVIFTTPNPFTLPPGVSTISGATPLPGLLQHYRLSMFKIRNVKY